MAEVYKIEKSFTKAVKYPLFGWFLSFVLALLKITIAGLPIAYPQVKDWGVVAILIFVYDWLKHNKGVKLP